MDEVQSSWVWAGLLPVAGLWDSAGRGNPDWEGGLSRCPGLGSHVAKVAAGSVMGVSPSVG